MIPTKKIRLECKTQIFVLLLLGFICVQKISNTRLLRKYWKYSSGLEVVHRKNNSTELEVFQKKNKTEIETVRWVQDKVWYEEQSQRGCCPYARQMYEFSYAHIGYRCCSERLHEMQPLRAVGGVDYAQLLELSQNNNNKSVSILLQGDSLAEQHFLGLLCFAWSSNITETISMERLSEINDEKPYGKEPGTMWKAQIGELLTIYFLRWDLPERAPPEFDRHIQSADYFIVSAWHHAVVKIPSFLQQLQAQRNGKPTILVDNLPQHKKGTQTEKLGQCFISNNSSGTDFNAELTAKIGNNDNFTLLRVSKLYQDRGDAHIGTTQNSGKNIKDCVHYCIAPGVWDAVAKETLAAVYSMERNRKL